MYLRLNSCKGRECWGMYPATPKSHVLKTASERCEVFQLCPTLCDPMDCSLPGSSHWNFQARVLEWVATSFSRGSSAPREDVIPSISGVFERCNSQHFWTAVHMQSVCSCGKERSQARRSKETRARTSGSQADGPKLLTVKEKCARP